MIFTILCKGLCIVAFTKQSRIHKYIYFCTCRRLKLEVCGQTHPKLNKFGGPLKDYYFLSFLTLLYNFSQLDVHLLSRVYTLSTDQRQKLSFAPCINCMQIPAQYLVSVFFTLKAFSRKMWNKKSHLFSICGKKVCLYLNVKSGSK